jgi:hypothetical protein
MLSQTFLPLHQKTYVLTASLAVFAFSLLFVVAVVARNPRWFVRRIGRVADFGIDLFVSGALRLVHLWGPTSTLMVGGVPWHEWVLVAELVNPPFAGTGPIHEISHQLHV